MIEQLRKIKKTAGKVVRLISQSFYTLFGSAFECNICHYRTNQFNSDGWHLYSICPGCYSSVRHRLVWAVLSFHPEFNSENILKGKSILHFAPESSLRDKYKKLAAVYKTADYFTEGYSYQGIDYNMDMTDMKAIVDNSLDCVIAMDVLEHIPDHKKALREIYRVLKKHGTCILTVPQKDNLEVTEEDLSLADGKLREEKFGQFDHWRIYGKDFTGMIQEAGFRVSVIDERFLDPVVVKRHVLFPPVLSLNPLATNFRKIYFGTKI